MTTRPGPWKQPDDGWSESAGGRRAARLVAAGLSGLVAVLYAGIAIRVVQAALLAVLVLLTVTPAAPRTTGPDAAL